MTDKEALDYTLNLAKKANENQIRPNPFVGALILDESGEILGEGYHQQIGGPHAEVFAVQSALKKKQDLSQCTLYVSLEPCSHYGKTPPCVDLILKHQIKRVVIASKDPNPKVNGIAILKANGVVAELMPDENAIKLNKIFFTIQQLKRPYFIIKTASTIDGKIADFEGKSKWITNANSREFVHKEMRMNVDAILTSAKTVIQDAAKLNIRMNALAEIETNIIIIDRHLKTLSNPALPIFYRRLEKKLYIITEHQHQSTRNDIEFIQGNFDENGLVFSSINQKLLELGLSKILIEAGSQINASVIEQGIVDELFLFIAPKLLNDSTGLSILTNFRKKHLESALKLKLLSSQVIGEDVLIHYQFENIAHA